jgi:hypothetical protein
MRLGTGLQKPGKGPLPARHEKWLRKVIDSDDFCAAEPYFSAESVTFYRALASSRGSDPSNQNGRRSRG